MATLVVQPCPEKFAEVPVFEDALEQLCDKEIKNIVSKVGEIFARHKVHDKLGLGIVHRHFEMSNDEILVETKNMDNSLSVCSPWKINGHAVQPSEEPLLNSYDIDSNGYQYVAPTNWFFDHSGELVAFEFITTNERMPFIPPREFVQELYVLLKELGVNNVVGIRLVKNGIRTSSWECTPDGTRANVTVFGERPNALQGKEMVQVGWNFDEMGQLVAEGEYCNSHCFGHGKR